MDLMAPMALVDEAAEARDLRAEVAPMAPMGMTTIPLEMITTLVVAGLAAAEARVRRAVAPMLHTAARAGEAVEARAPRVAVEPVATTILVLDPVDEAEAEEAKGAREAAIPERPVMITTSQHQGEAVQPVTALANRKEATVAGSTLTRKPMHEVDATFDGT